VVALLLVSGLTAAGCDRVPLDEMNEIYYHWDHKQVVCAANLDTRSGNDLDSIFAGLERARDRGEIIGLYTHNPGYTVPWDKLEAVVAKAAELKLDFITYPQLDGELPQRGGILLSFDDSAIESWYMARPMFDRYGAKVTFFVTRYDLWNEVERAELHDLAADGHAIEAHGKRHVRGPAYVTENGLGSYMSNEVLPSIELLRADGFTPTVFAYPFGMRTGETDREILKYVKRVRSVSFSVEGAVGDPCPE